jgi:hypothetical protein
VSENEKNDLDDSEDDKRKKKKKKRSQKKSSNLINDETPMSEGYMGGGNFFQAECPILDSIEKRCRGIDILSGAHQNLLEACGEHQLCYLCVSINNINIAWWFVANKNMYINLFHSLTL